MLKNIFSVEFFKQKNFILPVTIGTYFLVGIMLVLYRLITGSTMLDYTKGYLVIDFFSGIVAPFLLSNSVIQSVRQDKKAGNFLITNHLSNPYFEWGSAQIVFNWIYHVFITTLMILFLGLIFNKSFSYLIAFNILNLFMVSAISYILTRNFSEVFAYIISLAAIVISLIARTPLFDTTMLFIPITWNIRFTMYTMSIPKNFMIGISIFIIMDLVLITLNYVISKVKNLA
ncbi:hypothetical protein [Weissella sp. MSCH1]|uniref:hypothetical protein n=1 Tax=Weissella sp. MSCH1 TaxID=3383343 RepID=UPI003896E98C